MKSITTLIQNERPLTVFVLPKKTEQGKREDRETDCTLSPPLSQENFGLLLTFIEAALRFSKRFDVVFSHYIWFPLLYVYV